MSEIDAPSQRDLLHAAAGALAAAQRICPDRLRSHGAVKLFSSLELSVGGDGSTARKQASALATLIETAAAAEPTSRPLLLALERWLLHPGRDSASELASAVDSYRDGAGEELRRLMWVSGPGLSGALDAVDRCGLDGTPTEVLAVIAEAVDGVVPASWLAKRLETTRDALSRRLRGLRAASRG